MKTVKKLSSIATMFIFVAASLVSCEKDDNSTTPEQPIIPSNLSGIVELDTYNVDFGTFKATAPKASKAVKEQQADTTVVLTLTNGSSLKIKGLSSSVDFDGGGVATKIKWSGLEPGESIQVPYEYKINEEFPGTFTGTASLTPTFENDSIGEPLKTTLKVIIE